MRGNETDNKPPKYSKLNLEYQDFNYKTNSLESISLSLLYHNDNIFHTLCIKRLANYCYNYKAKCFHSSYVSQWTYLKQCSNIEEKHHKDCKYFHVKCRKERSSETLVTNLQHFLYLYEIPFLCQYPIIFCNIKYNLWMLCDDKKFWAPHYEIKTSNPRQKVARNHMETLFVFVIDVLCLDLTIMWYWYRTMQYIVFCFRFHLFLLPNAA